MSKVMDIGAWAKETGADRRKRRCQVCTLPPEILEEITRGWRELGYRAKVVSAYLDAAGHPVSRPMLVYHFGESGHGGAK